MTALVLAHVAVVAVGLTLRLAFQQRLPEGQATEVGTWAACQVILVGVIAAYIVRTSWSTEESLDQIAERILPNTLMAAGAVLSMMVSVVVDNLDVRAAASGPSPFSWILIFSGVYLSSIVGRRLGSAASARRFRLGRPARRVSWMATVGVDGAWRLGPGVAYSAMLIVPLVLVWATTSQGFPVLIALWLAAIWWVAVGMGPTAVVFITETGIRVVSRSLEGVPGWAVPVADIASVSVVEAEPALQLVIGWNSRRCVLRAGPALEVTTSDARRYVVSLPAAAEAAAVLHGVAGSRRPQSTGSTVGASRVD